MVTFFGLSKKAGPPEKNGASTPESLPLGSKGRLEMAAGALQCGADNDTSAPLALFIKICQRISSRIFSSRYASSSASPMPRTASL